ncbi:MAG: DUF3108 domain-containing protein [Burkholderiaceae bacterium]|jgi:hypothetical protein|nr:DUF3108 domain-containing protein [Burkholderiaceae bacterium]
MISFPFALRLALAAAALAPSAALAAAPAAPPPSVPAAAASSHAGVRVPPSAQLIYKVEGRTRGLPVGAQAALDWRQDGARYTAHWTFTGPLGIRREQESSGQLTPQGLAPERFDERNRTAHFQRGTGRIVFSNGASPAQLAPGAQDRLSVSVQLGALIAAAPGRFPPGAQVTLQVAGVRGADSWTFTVQGDETLRLAGQAMPCIKLERRASGPSGQRITLWLARNAHYLPVRLRIAEANGDVADQQLTQLRKQGTSE